VRVPPCTEFGARFTTTASPSLGSPGAGAFRRQQFPLMPRFWWLTYRKAGRLVDVVIVEAPSPIHARLMTAVRGIDAGTPFAEGHELDTDLVELIPAAQIGRMLSGAEAAKLLARFDGKPRRSKK
jgi:hypothetical protein